MRPPENTLSPEEVTEKEAEAGRGLLTCWQQAAVGAEGLGPASSFP